MTDLTPPPEPSVEPPAPLPANVPPTRPIKYSRRQTLIGVAIAIFGLLVFLIGARPGLFGLDRSLVIGFVQIVVFLAGLAIICLGGYLSLISLWLGQPISIAADIGLRMIATGYVIAVFSAMADVIGIGSQHPPRLPLFGPWQARGVELGQALIGLGFLLLIPYWRRRQPPA